MTKRAEFTTLTKLKAMARYARCPGEVECSCASCGKNFVRPYRMNAKRKLKPQYCSKACLAHARKINAEIRLAERFWSKVYRDADPDKCWVWRAQIDKNGYGKFQLRHGEPALAHRVSYMLAHGYMPPSEQLVCHECDNPPCVNPKHLWLGDDKTNHDDCVAKGRHSPIPVVRGSAVNTSKLTEAQAREVLTSPLSNTQLGQKFGVSKTAIRLIRTGKNWSHLREAS
jgi:hypothetical protein